MSETSTPETFLTDVDTFVTGLGAGMRVGKQQVGA